MESTAASKLTQLAAEMRRDRYPFAFNVKTHSADFALKTLAPLASEMSTAATPERMALALSNADPEDLYSMALEDAQNGLLEDDTFKSTREGESAEIEWGFVGRSGGWAVIVAFDGVNLKNGFDFEGVEDEEWMVKLLRFVESYREELNPDAASREVESRAAWILAMRCEAMEEEEHEAMRCEAIMHL